MPTVSVQIAAGADDAGHILQFAWSNTYATFTIGNEGGQAGSSGWFRFASVAVPQGQVLDSATLTLRNDGLASGAAQANWRVGFDDADSSAMPADGTEALARALTGPIDFALAPPHPNGEVVLDVLAAAQAVVSRPGFASGNAMSVAVRDNVSPTNGYMRVHHFNGQPLLSAVLTLTWTEGGGPPPGGASDAPPRSGILEYGGMTGKLVQREAY